MTRDELLAGPQLKLGYAAFHYEQMLRAIEAPRNTTQEVAMMATGAIIDTGWQRKVYPHFDALLAAARSVPDIIRCCFGWDAAPPMRAWRAGLSMEEAERRKLFEEKFEPALGRFRKLPLSGSRNVSAHRSGVVAVEVRISGRFGVEHIGGPTKLVPVSESLDLPARGLPFIDQPVAVPTPRWDDFTIDGVPLFEAARQYVHDTGLLLADSAKLAEDVHGGNEITSPPQ